MANWQLNIPINAKFADMICDEIAAGKTLREVCAVSWMPTEATVRNWLANEPAFKKAYEAAILVRTENDLADCVGIADATPVDKEFIAKSKLRIDTRMKIAGFVAPERYSPKAELNLSAKEPVLFKMIAADERL